MDQKSTFAETENRMGTNGRAAAPSRPRTRSAHLSCALLLALVMMIGVGKGWAQTQCAYVEDFNVAPANTEQVDKWVSNSILTVKSNGNDPKIILPNLSIDPTQYRYIYICYRIVSPHQYTGNLNAEIFYMNECTQGVAATYHSAIKSIPAGNVWNTLRFDMVDEHVQIPSTAPCKKCWTDGGTITGLRFDFCNASNVTMEIDYIVVSNSSTDPTPLLVNNTLNRNQTVCAGTPVDITFTYANASSLAADGLPQGLTLSNQGNNTYKITGTPTESRTYTVTTVGGGCRDTSVTSHITLYSQVTITSSSGQPTVCSGQNATFQEENGNNAVWSKTPCPSYNGYKSDFNSFDSYDCHNTTLTINNGVLTVQSATTGALGDPWFSMEKVTNLSPSTYNKFAVSYRVTSGNNTGNVLVYLYAANHPNADGDYYIDLGSFITDGGWHIAEGNVPTKTTGNQNPGNITGWRFDYTSGGAITMEIEYIQLTRSSTTNGASSYTWESPGNGPHTVYANPVWNACPSTCAQYPFTVSNGPATPTNLLEGSRCGAGEVTLSATPAAGCECRWYDAQTNGTLKGTGNNFTTPSINTTTDY